MGGGCPGRCGRWGDHRAPDVLGSVSAADAGDYLVARRAEVSLVRSASGSGRSVRDARFVPPHPGPVTAMRLLDADGDAGLGIWSRSRRSSSSGRSTENRWPLVVMDAATSSTPRSRPVARTAARRSPSHRDDPPAGALMLAKAMADIVMTTRGWGPEGLRRRRGAVHRPADGRARRDGDLRRRGRHGQVHLRRTMSESPPPIAGILLIVSGGGGSSRRWSTAASGPFSPTGHGTRTSPSCCSRGRSPC